MQLQKERMLGYWCIRTGHALKARVESRIGPIGLTAPEAGILVHISNLGTTSLAELAREIQHTHPSVLRHLDALEDRGLILRTPHPSDRRVKQVALTEAGQEIIPKLKEAFIETQREATSGLDPDDIERVLAVLRRVAEQLSDADNEGRSTRAHATQEVDDGA